MPVVYTISHPFTNDIVYVGYSTNLSKRAYRHLTTLKNSDLAEWVSSMLSNYMIPKVEMIDEFESKSDAIYYEGYYIQQLTAWGFNLFNKTKNLYTLPVIKLKRNKEKGITGYKSPYYKPRKSQPKWNETKFTIGKKYEFPMDSKKINSFRAMFNYYAKMMNMNVHLLRTDFDGSVTLTVSEGLKERKEIYGFSKSGKPKYYKAKEKNIKPPKTMKLTRYSFKNSQVGDVFTVPADKVVSFQNCFGNFIKIKGHVLDWVKKEIQPGLFTYEMVEPDLTKNFGRGRRISKIIQSKIISDNRPIKHIAKELNLSYAVVWKYKKLNQLN